MATSRGPNTADAADATGPSHYDNVAETYEDAFFYEDNSPFQEWMFQQVLAHLGLAEHHRVRRNHSRGVAPIT
jgi:hypothetical protein